MSDQRSVRVVVAEDDYLVGEMIKGLLQDLGYTVVGEAANGLEAVEMTESLHPDIVLMDIKMPDMDGIEAAQLMSERCPTPVVVLTAYDTLEMVQQASAAGVGAYLIKPPDASEMERAITISRARFDDMMELRHLNANLRAEITERKRLDAEKERLIGELKSALTEIKALRGILPICSSCKKIRDDKGYWQQVEVYVREHSEAEFTHSLCPECAKKLYPQFYKEKDTE